MKTVLLILIFLFQGRAYALCSSKDMQYLEQIHKLRSSHQYTEALRYVDLLSPKCSFRLRIEF